MRFDMLNAMVRPILVSGPDALRPARRQLPGTLGIWYALKFMRVPGSGVRKHARGARKSGPGCPPRAS